ncbi:GntR family transcriptional regulator [Geosporobacter ferrireducens]|uniref:GntR family transcriptional regulator n=1 Tax=Geosporobacter ferrireducens TaxID=1424294 RepID=A0A1D8GKY7_9FIRM|nr:GntR family transcriptional regulator [Geosporobacter ferrireducens]AOT71576.1 GntR family transcriptional regulator [Geosporobacter ferrireducens]MTI57891.1 GntR family transcriptional regulator [Geosporobacter ferrireducens]
MKINITNQSDKIEKDSVIPVYYQLAKIFEKQIYEGKLRPGEALLPEYDIAEKYGISRMTVRRAIAELVSAGLVYTQKGKGTFVSKPKLDNVVFELGDFHKEIIGRGMKPSTKLLSVKIVKADKHLGNKLRVEVGTSCLFFRMILAANEEPLVYENKYVVFSKQKPILETELKDPSLSNLAAIHSEYLPTISKKILHASIVKADEAKILGIPLNTPVFVVEQTVYNAEKKPMGWGTSVYRGDRYKLTSYTGWSIED